MRALLHHIGISLTLNFRNRMAVIYGYLFPLLFLLAFWAIYRDDQVPLLLHMGALLTVTVLGGACFGLPTAMVSERERGVWRRYRLAPLSTGAFIASAVVTRYLLLLSAAMLQLLLAVAVGMPVPGHLPELLVAFTGVSIGFLGLGMMIAMLADTVPAVQALGQCIFLPMLMIGGVAVPLTSLPAWAQHVSAFLPGRYAVQALQQVLSGNGLGAAFLDLVALLLIGVGGAASATRMFRWDARQRLSARDGLLGAALALSVFALVGATAELRGDAVQAATDDTDAAQMALAPPGGPASWQAVTPADMGGVAFERLPPDGGIVAPIAGANEVPDALVAGQLAEIRAALAGWPPGKAADPVQRVRNDLYVAAVPDVLKMEQVERFVPLLVFEKLRRDVPERDLKRILYWVAMHPQEGDESALHAMKMLGLPDAREPSRTVRQRVMLYAFKFLGRLTGSIAVQ